MLFITSLLLVLSPFVTPKIFTPCELAQKLNERFTEQLAKGLASREEVARYYTDIGLLVCIAGYHNYSTSHVRVTEDRVVHNGIFGIVPQDLKGDPSLLLDENIDLDVKTFIEKVLYVGGTSHSNVNTRNFYKGLCEWPSVTYVKCYLNNYVFGGYEVPVPTRPERLYETYQNRSSIIPRDP